MAWPVVDRDGATAHAFEPNSGSPRLRLAERTAASPFWTASFADSTAAGTSAIRDAVSAGVKSMKS